MTQAVMFAILMLRQKKMRYGKMPRYRQMGQMEHKAVLTMCLGKMDGEPQMGNLLVPMENKKQVLGLNKMFGIR